MKNIYLIVLMTVLLISCLVNASEQGRITFVSFSSGRWDLWTADADGGDLRQLTDTLSDERSPSWSPDGKQFVYATTPGKLFLLDVEQVERTELQLPSRKNAEPCWSPDGKAVVYISYTQPRAYQNEVWMAVLDEQGIRAEQIRIPDGLKVFPAWSPDGQSLVYSRFIGHGAAGPVEDLVRFDLMLRQEKTLMSNGFDNLHAAWSPDGKTLAYASNQSGNYDIWLWRPDEAEPRQLTHHPAMETDPTWSPDGREIAFVSSESGIQQIWVVEVSAGIQRQLTFHEGGSRDPAWGK